MSFESVNLRVALCTDAIIYAPFYLAYLSNDFKENPFETNIEITIVDNDNDIFKPQQSKLRGDDFVLFCLLFDIADVGICDPAVLIHFFNSPQEFYEPLCKFKESISERYKAVIDKIDLILLDEEICEKELAELKENQAKVIGGLVSNLALNIVSPSSDLNSINQFNTHRPPSTVYYLVKDHYKGELDFGEELNDVSSLKESNGIITCDLIASEIFDSIAYKSFYNIQVHEISAVKTKLGLNHNDQFLFSGILGNLKPQKLKLIQAFLYCIDKKLYKINYFLANKNFYGLKKYFSHKLLDNLHNSNLVKDLLISNESFYNSFSDEFKIEGEKLNNLLLETFINKLSKLKRNGIEIFPSKVEFENEALEAAIKNRLGNDFNSSWKNYCDLTLLKKWHRTERRTSFYSNFLFTRYIWKQIKNERFVWLLPTILTSFGFLSDLSQFLEINLDYRDFIRQLFWKVKFYPTDSLVERIHDAPFWLFLFIVVYSLLVLIITYKYVKNENYVYRKR